MGGFERLPFAKTMKVLIKNSKSHIKKGRNNSLENQTFILRQNEYAENAKTTKSLVIKYHRVSEKLPNDVGGNFSYCFRLS